MRRQLGVFAAMAALVGIYSHAAHATTTRMQKEMNAAGYRTGMNARQVAPTTPGANPYKHNRTPKQNQRQKRKHLRQVHQLRGTKKGYGLKRR